MPSLDDYYINAYGGKAASVPVNLLSFQGSGSSGSGSGFSIGKDTFSAVGGAVSDLFAGMGAEANASLKAQGLQMGAAGTRLTAQGTLLGAEGTRIGAQGTRIGAEGTRIGAEGTRIGAAGQRMGAEGTRIGASGQRLTAEGTRIGAEETRISAAGLRVKAQGDLAEATNYDLAAGLARKNVDYVVQSTAIQMSQLDRKIAMTIGGQRADIGGAGLKESGSAIYLLADSSRQGAIAKDVLAKQGEISEAGYEEQAKSYDTMSAAARMAYAGEMEIAARTEGVATRQEGIATGQESIANRTDQLAAMQDDIARRTDLLAGRQEGIATAQEGLATREEGIATGQEGIAAGQRALASQQDAIAVQTEEAGKQQAQGDYISAAIKGAAAVATLL